MKNNTSSRNGRKYILWPFIIASTVILFVSLMISCRFIPLSTAHPSIHDTIMVKVSVPDSAAIKSLELAVYERDIKIQALNDSIYFYKMRTQKQDYKNAFALNQIEFYVSICNSRPVNKKYFFGWVKRALSNR